jgi:hypothetical protein
VTQRPPPDPFDRDRASNQPPEPIPALPLEYGSYNRPPSRLAFFGRIVAGFFGYIVLSVVWFRFAAASRLGPVVLLAGWAAMTAALLGFAYYLRRRHGRAGYGYGILLVFLVVAGVILLIIGICWNAK